MTSTTTCTNYLINSADNSLRLITIDANDGGSSGHIQAVNPSDGFTIDVVGTQFSQSVCVVNSASSSLETFGSVATFGIFYSMFLAVIVLTAWLLVAIYRKK